MEALAGEVHQVQRLQREQRPVEGLDLIGEQEAHQQRRERHGHQRPEGERDN